MGIRLVDCRWLKIKEMELDKMEMFDMVIMERIFLRYLTLVPYIIMWPPTSFWTWFRVWFWFYVRVCFRFYGWILSGGSGVPIVRFFSSRMPSLVKLFHFRYDIFDVVWDSRSILVILHARPLLWERIVFMNSYSYPTMLLKVLDLRIYHLLGVY